MSSSSRITDLLTRARDSEDASVRDQAYAELTQLLMMLVRASMSVRIRRGGGGRESMDVCQSLARSFVAEIEDGRIRFDSEAALVAYLHRVVKNKLTDLARLDAAQKRGGQAPQAVGNSETGVASPARAPVRLDPDRLAEPGAGKTANPAASSIAANREAARLIQTQLSDEDRSLIDLRNRGLSWAMIAEMLNAGEPTVRKRWSRLQERIESSLREQA